MNDPRPYDQSLRDKLNSLPVPDMHKSWQEMRTLLDKEMPEDGRSRRRGGWWFFSALLIFIIAGSWTLLTMNFSKQNVDPPLSATQNTSPPPAIVSGSDNAEAGTRKTSEKPGVEDDKILLSKEQTPDNNKSNDQPVAVSTSKGEKQSGATVTGIEPAITDPVSGKNNHSGNKAVVIGVAADGLRNGNILSSPKGPSSYAKDPSVLGAGGLSGVDPKTELAKASTVRGIERFPLGSFAETVDSISMDYGSYITYAPVSRKYYRQNKKYGRPANIRPPYTTAGRNFAIGLSLPLVFPLGDQRALSYNVNAKPNTATDYLPAPHAQFHFNEKVYVQSELQVLSPQYIKPALLYQSKTSNNFYQTTNSVSAQKLYYFNVPVSLHYSPFNHFYMGTGLQFSSLLSGVAMHEQYRSGMVSSDSIYTVSYSKFSNDSISNKLSGSEMRLMLDANYYFNKFTVGLRYNQALSNYVSTRAAPMAPLTVDKNKSLQFYLRYNLWEDKKRKTPNAVVVK
jgi:hypothetical protein